MANVSNLKVAEPTNRLRGSLPKIGIRPTIDGRYGGVRESGLGREGVRYAMEDMTEPRLLVIRDA